MIYSNSDPMALYAMECDRTGNYGEYETCGNGDMCPVCSAYEPENFYLNDDEECIGCSECIIKSDVLY